MEQPEWRREINNVRELMNERDLRYEQRFKAAEEAVRKAEAASEKRFDAVNEFRATLADQQRTLMPRPEAEVLLKAMEEKIEATNSKIDVAIQAAIERKGEGTGTKAGTAYIIAIIGVVFGLIGLVSRFVK